MAPFDWDSNNMKSTLPDLEGRVVILYLENRSLDHVVVLESPVFEMQGGRLFICGDIPEGVSPNDWATGIVSSVAWERVEEYLVFNSLDEYLKRASMAMDDSMLQ